MYKMTKAQRKLRGQIDMWLKGEMELDPDEVTIPTAKACGLLQITYQALMPNSPPAIMLDLWRGY